MQKKGVFLRTVAFILVVSGSMCAEANVLIDWDWCGSTMGMVYRNGGSELVPAGSTLQLIWSPDATPSFNDAAPLTPLDPNEVVLSTRTLPGDDSLGNSGWWLLGSASYDESTYGKPAGSFVGGYIYQRVFDTPYGSTPAAGSWYATESSAEILNTGTLKAPSTVNLTHFMTDGDFSLDQQIVPEPATMALLGLGLAVVGLRRKIHG